MKKSYWLVLVHLGFLIICCILLKFIVKPNELVPYKFLSGFLVGTFAMFGKEIAKLIGACAIRRRIPVFDTNPWSNTLVLIAFFILALAGLFAWFVSWEGSTRISFGLAVFFAALLSDVGFVPLFAEFMPSKSNRAVA